MRVTAYEIAQRFVGTAEAPGVASNPLVLAMLRLDNTWVAGDSTAWCSAFVSFVAWLLRLPRSRSLAARSWLGIGVPVPLEQARPGFDVVILQRGSGVQPGPEVTTGVPGHVGFFAGLEGEFVQVLGGNQSDAVTLQRFPRGQVLGVRRLLEDA